MIAVVITTSSAAVPMLRGQIDGISTQLGHNGFTFANMTLINAIFQASLIVLMLVCAMTVVICSTIKVWGANETTRVNSFAIERLL